MNTEDYTNFIADICKREYSKQLKIELSRPEENFGDFATNCALKLAKQVSKSPQQVAQNIADKLQEHPDFASVSVEGPGFINITLKDEVLFGGLSSITTPPQPHKDKVVVAEYSDANSFKALHGGHLYTSLVGDAVANILESAGAQVYRTNFGGDVGLHVAKAMWAIINKLGGEYPEKLEKISDDRLDWVSQRYVEGSTAYEQNIKTQEAIQKLNQRVYDIHKLGDQESDLAKIYWTCRQWSYEGFEKLYQRLGMKPFDKYYPESSISDLGVETVKKHTGDIYKESEGAIVYDAEDDGLFTQVFITSQGLPTYAGKDVGLILAKYRDYKFDMSYMITDASQKDHIAVVLKSIEKFAPELVNNTVHHTHGRVKLAGGQKMSSRLGNVLLANDILQATDDAYRSQTGKNDSVITIGALKYSFLKIRTGGDITYDPKESVSLEGNSGPYLQYAAVRANSILSKANPTESYPKITLNKLNASERSLARAISQYPEILRVAIKDLSPHHICNYLYELCQIFNKFYDNNRVLDDPRSQLRLQLVKYYADVLNNGLSILGINVPEKM